MQNEMDGNRNHRNRRCNDCRELGVRKYTRIWGDDQCDNLGKLLISAFVNVKGIIKVMNYVSMHAAYILR